MKTIINETFKFIHSVMTAQFLRIQNSCSDLIKEFDYLVSEMLKNDMIANNESTHIQSCVRGRLKNAYIRFFDLSNRIFEIQIIDFVNMMKNAMIQCSIHAVN